MEIQVDPALQRLAGNKALYLNLALCFPDDVKAMLSQLRAGMAAADCVNVLHNMKGVAATLGAEALAQRAAELEKLARQGARPVDDAAVMAALEVLIETSLHALADTVTKLRPAPSAATAPVDMAELRTMLAELADLLMAGNMRALSIFAKLQYRFGAVSCLQSSSRLAELASAMNRLDFAAAWESCQRLDAALSKSDP